MDAIERQATAEIAPAPLGNGELPEARWAARVADLLIASEPALPSVRSDLQIRAEERSRIGRELHDSTSQLLVGLQLSLARLKQTFRARGREPLFAELDSILTELHREVRAVISNDRAFSFEPRELPRALQAMALKFGRLTNLRVHVSLPAKYVAPAFETELSFYRIAQEALANVARHARAQAVTMRLDSNSCSLRLRIDDDGIGFLPRTHLAESGGTGLENIRQRVERLRGRMSLRKLHKGSRLSVTVDL